MLRVEPATFWMGSPADENDRDSDELRHEVKLPQAFEIGRTEVTQGQWTSVMKANPSRFQSSEDAPSHPVERINWFEAVEYLNRLSSRQGLPACYQMTGCDGEIGRDYTCSSVGYAGPSCRGYRLPTEAEWEFAARAGSQQARYGDLDAIAWHGGNSEGRTHPVARTVANSLGLHDMIGNVDEWTNDEYRSYAASTDEGAPITDPGAASWSTVPRRAVIRGCAWDSGAAGCRAANRIPQRARLAASTSVGFRPARSVP